MPKRVAIVGSGCSGTGALWALRNTDHEVHLYESASRLGGNHNTAVFKGPAGQTTNVDTGSLVLNSTTDPNLTAFLKHIHVPTVKSKLSFGVSRDAGDFEWAGSSFSSIFAQKGNIFKPRMWKFIFDVIRFNHFAWDLLRDDHNETDPTKASKERPFLGFRQESIGEYLDKQRYSQAFRENYLVPMATAVGGASADNCALDLPATTLVRLLWNHHLLNTTSALPEWVTISGGSQLYIDTVMQDFPQDRVHLQTRVLGVTPSTHGPITLLTENGMEEFEHVILALQGDHTLEIMSETATQEERDILAGFGTSKNVTILHSDLKFMPKRRVAWSAWNFITESPFPPSSITTNVPKVCLTYWTNPLQNIPENEFGDVLVTVNPLSPPDPQFVQGIWEYSHPVYDAEAIRSQALLPGIQNRRGISYCGAWTRYGSHEDGFSSGLAVAVDHLGATLPFEFVDSAFPGGTKPRLPRNDLLVRVVVQLIQLAIRLVEAVGATTWAALDKRVAAMRKEE